MTKLICWKQKYPSVEFSQKTQKHQCQYHTTIIFFLLKPISTFFSVYVYNYLRLHGNVNTKVCR